MCNIFVICSVHVYAEFVKVKKVNYIHCMYYSFIISFIYQGYGPVIIHESYVPYLTKDFRHLHHCGSSLALVTWESQVLLTYGQVVFPRVLQFLPSFDERLAWYKLNILERSVTPPPPPPPPPKKKKKIQSSYLECYCYICFTTKPS